MTNKFLSLEINENAQFIIKQSPHNAPILSSSFFNALDP